MSKDFCAAKEFDIVTAALDEVEDGDVQALGRAAAQRLYNKAREAENSDRSLRTSRRMAAVEALITAGWKWDDKRWIPPVGVKQKIKCPSCNGSGEHCHSGSAHPLNWYDCDKCAGTGFIES